MGMRCPRRVDGEIGSGDVQRVDLAYRRGGQPKKLGDDPHFHCQLLHVGSLVEAARLPGMSISRNTMAGATTKFFFHKLGCMDATSLMVESYSLER